MGPLGYHWDVLSNTYCFSGTALAAIKMTHIFTLRFSRRKEKSIIYHIQIFDNLYQFFREKHPAYEFSNSYLNFLRMNTPYL